MHEKLDSDQVAIKMDPETESVEIGAMEVLQETEG